MKKLLLSLVISYMLLVISFAPASAQEADCVQVTQYGGAVGIVCGAKHEPVETGLADINPIVLSAAFFMAAGYAGYLYRKSLKAEVAL